MHNLCKMIVTTSSFSWVASLRRFFFRKTCCGWWCLVVSLRRFFFWENLLWLMMFLWKANRVFTPWRHGLRLLQAVLRRRGGEHERVTSPYGSHGLGTVCGFGGRPGWRSCQMVKNSEWVKKMCKKYTSSIKMIDYPEKYTQVSRSTVFGIQKK